jgi:hypothetical protein
VQKIGFTVSSNLSAEVSSLQYTYFADDFIMEEVTAVQLDLKDIADACLQNPSEQLEKSILTGMRFPVIVVPNTKEEYDKAVVGLSNKMPYDATKKYLCIIGNQRVTIARKYFDSIDAFITDSGIKSIIIKFTYEEIHGKL